jgi:prepilin-type N-terminal cleavage/methylation domain-containing protein
MLERRSRAGAFVRTPGGVRLGRRARNRQGFTLIELLVALTIGALAVLLAHQIFAAVADRGRSLVCARTVLDREVNARRWLEAAFFSLDVDTDSGGFDGRPSRVRFGSWLRTSDGWFERRAVVLGREEGRLIASVTPGDPIRLLDNVTDLQFDYLLEPGAGSRWVREWVSPVSAPVAVRLRVMRLREQGEAEALVDTLLFLIGERG